MIPSFHELISGLVALKVCKATGMFERPIEKSIQSVAIPARLLKVGMKIRAVNQSGQPEIRTIVNVIQSSKDKLIVEIKTPTGQLYSEFLNRNQSLNILKQK